MKEAKKTFSYIIAAFLLLCLVSLYRQISIHYFPEDPFRPFLTYGTYVFLIASWTRSLHGRITQKTMLTCLSVETFVLFLWLTVRLFQDTLLYKNTHIMRVSGYLIVFPLVFVTLMGLYASFGLDRGDGYRIPKSSFLLLIPDALLIILMLTNEQTHFVFKVYDNEEENLEFHSNFGIILILLWGSAMIIARLFIILRKARDIKAGPLKKLLPLIFGVAMPIVVIPYFINDFVAKRELIELTAKLYFLEAMSWESCIILGMVPVNTQYGQVFRKSTVGMQILDKSGEAVLSSEYARPISDEELYVLFRDKCFCDDSGQEIRIHSIKSGYLVYQKDISGILSIIEELHEKEELLTHERTMLSREIAARSEKAKVELRNNIYDGLSSDIMVYLQQMDELLDKLTPDNSIRTFTQLCLMGTYIKRRSNLKLIYEQSGSLDMEDLRFSLEEFCSCFRQVGIRSSLRWVPILQLSPQEILSVTDMIEEVMEENSFDLESVSLCADQSFTVIAKAPGAEPKNYSFNREAEI